MARADGQPRVVQARHHVGPAWPPSITAYDYVLTLCWSDLAWEFLRRNPNYQRDWRLSRKGIPPPRRLLCGTLLTRLRRSMPRAHRWQLNVFAEPTCPAPSAPVCWSVGTAPTSLHAVAARPNNSTLAKPLVVSRHVAAHIVIGPHSNEALVLRDSAQATAIYTAGSRISVGPAALAPLIDDFSDLTATTDTLHGLVALNRQPRIWVDRSRERLLLRDALIDLDGRCFGASYRDTAEVIVGPKRAHTAWASASTALKEHLRRARAKGQALRDGGYRELLERGCRFEP